MFWPRRPDDGVVLLTKHYVCIVRALCPSLACCDVQLTASSSYLGSALSVVYIHSITVAICANLPVRLINLCSTCLDDFVFPFEVMEMGAASIQKTNLFG